MKEYDGRPHSALFDVEAPATGNVNLSHDSLRALD
jgi:hypothetical protein